MKVMVRIKTEKLVEVATLHVDAGVRYWEDTTVDGVDDEKGNLIPCREGDRWKPIIDLETGKIINWKKGITADIHYKVCDDGEYGIVDAEGNIIKTIEGYVPNIMCPKDEGYGDYIIMDVDENGFIADWKPDVSVFNDDEY